MNLVDLTMPLDEHTPVFPGDLRQDIKQVATIGTNGWNELRLTFNSHFGTHIDVPAHMIVGGRTLSDYSLDRFVGDAVVVDARSITHCDLSGIGAGDIVFFYTQHTENISSDNFFKKNPVIIPTLAQTLISKKVKMVGIDSFTVDNAPFEVHKLLLGNDVLIVENLVHLKELVGKRFRCYVLPLKITGGDGAPCRVIGVLP